MIRTKCPACGRWVRWDVAEATTEVRQHTCPNGHRFAVKVFPARDGVVQGRPAKLTRLEWTPVKGTAPCEAGLVIANKRTGANVYLAEAQGVDVAGARYAVICKHGSTAPSTSKRDAAVLAAYPDNFCEECRTAGNHVGPARDLAAEYLATRRHP